MLHNAIEKGHNVVFQWIPSHCGISGNDLADEAARKAHVETNLVSTPLSRIDAARYLSKLAQNITIQKWQSSQFTNHRLYSLDPSLRLRLLPGLSREEGTVLCRLRLGVAFTNAYSFKIEMADNAECNDCAVDETIEHILCCCPTYANERLHLRTALHQLDGSVFTVEKVLGPWGCPSQLHKATKALLRFLKDTGLIRRL
uniref:Tick transposon n=1 Tax=Rhipicephalus appendiculatus TaxID=34631 RepID=A0A131YZP8_RHIAP